MSSPVQVTVNPKTRRGGRNRVSSWASASKALIVGAPLLLVDISLERNRRNREGYCKVPRIELDDGFFACLAHHPIEANRGTADRLSEAVSLLQQRGIS